ncbi:MAG: PQQ-binding-like beta-propeller repeat protein [Candidatus Omnitrophica bacterium]|nr:PQQ-binding-like beta-propeller repeat protein [Candidatus Omnitrophota bacterium]
MPYRFMTLLSLSLACLLHAVTVRAEGCIARWRFEKDRLAGNSLPAAEGQGAIQITGPVTWGAAEDALPCLYIDQRDNKVEVQGVGEALSALREGFSVETWVNIDKTTEWSGIIGQLSGNKGWQLGYRQSNFSFGISTENVGEIRHFRARESLEWGRWYHVVGTHDGKETRLYVNGGLANASQACPGRMLAPADAPVLIGTREDFYGRLWVHEIALHSRALSEGEVAARFQEKQGSLPTHIRPKLGPILTRLDESSVRIRWETDRECVSEILWGESAPPTRSAWKDASPTNRHEAILTGLEDKKIYHYRLRFSDDSGSVRVSRIFEFDSSLDYAAKPSPVRGEPFPADELSPIYSRAAERILAETGVHRGYCLVLDAGKGRLAHALAERSELKVVCLEEDRALVDAGRTALDQIGAYGTRITFQRTDSEKLPFPNYLFNLIVSDGALVSGKLPKSSAEVARALRPSGGVLALEAPKESAEALKAWWGNPSAPEFTMEKAENGTLRVRRGDLPGGGEWTHQYADPGNTACSLDQHVKGNLEVLWFGRPGPRPMVDRGTRSPAPLSRNGMLFVQGDRLLFGMDAYNGSIYWSVNAPELRRANMPRDGSNMTLSDDGLFVAVRESCWKFDPESGEVLAVWPAAPETPRDDFDWGYIASVGGQLLGSAVRRGALFIGADGEWYDRSDEEALKVTSDTLFALDSKTGGRLWEYRKGLIINPTICASETAVYFLESRNPSLLAGEDRRIGDELFTDQFQVALDIRTGKVLWEKSVRFEGGSWVLYQVYAKDTLVVLATTDKYHLHGIDARSGDSLWEQHYSWRKDNHGGSMQHPVVIEGTIFAEPNAYELRTGKLVRENIPQRDKCGTMSGAANAIVCRDYYHTIWDLETDTWTQLEGVRAGCWLNILPVGGIVVAPEASSGCFCDHPIQTSIAFLPKEKD